VLIKCSQKQNLEVTLFDHQDFYGNSPMHVACMAGKADCLRILIKNGGDVTQENKEGFTPQEISQ
jgi:ankyrin repeat protein